MEHEFGLEDESGDVDVSKGQHNAVIEMTDTRFLEVFNWGKDNSIHIDSGASRRTGHKGCVGASKVNHEYPVRKMTHRKKNSVVENLLLKGTLAASAVQTPMPMKEVQSLRDTKLLELPWQYYLVVDLTLVTWL